MKKGHIRILVVVMSVALIGLLAVQWFWVRNAVALREKQFQQRVMSAMESVTEHLQDQEIVMAIGQGAAFGNPFMQHNVGRDLCGFANPMGLQPLEPYGPRKDSTPTRIIQHQVSSRRMVGGQWVSEQSVETRVTQGDSELVIHDYLGDPHAKNYAHGFVERMLQSDRPIHQRLNVDLLDTLLHIELQRREIDEHFHFNVISELFVPTGFRDQPKLSVIDHDREYFRSLLFPHDIRPSGHYLELQFPDRASQSMRAMGLVLPTSGVLVTIVMACFGIALLAFRKQQKVSDMKTDFINNMTHELKTPISTISLALEALGDPDMQTKERIGMYARVIGQENERLKTQVDRVLQAAALERGELKLELKPLDLEELLLTQLARIQLHVESRGGKITYHSEATDTSVVADETHLGGVILNLLDNANKYSPEAPQIDVRLSDAPGGLSIAVEDHGLGISPDAQRRVFESFYRVPTGNVHDVKGFGIGLSYARSMAKAHGGDIHLSSTLGKGSIFTLFIPTKTQ